MISVGQRLRQAREAKGLTVQQVAAQTKISSRYLQAIEADDPKSLPGIFFYKSFVQQYAGCLGVPMEELRWALDRLAPPPERIVEQVSDLPEPQTQFLREPEPITSQLGFRVGVLILMLIACSAVYAIWDKMQRNAAAPAVQTTQDSKVTARETAKQVEAAPVPAPAPASASAPPIVTTEPAPESALPPISVSKVSLLIKAKEQTWFRVTGDGKVEFAGTLEPEQSKAFDGFDRASLLVGNAGGLDVTFNGKPMGAIGPRGQIRTVLFTPEKYSVQIPDNF